MVVYLFVVIQIYNKFSGFLLFFTIIYNLSLEMSDEPKKMGTTNCTPYMTTEKNCRFSLKISHRFSVKETGLPQKEAGLYS